MTHIGVARFVVTLLAPVFACLIFLTNGAHPVLAQQEEIVWIQIEAYQSRQVAMQACWPM
ncbi:MAG: hypothetical protein GDA36_04490 [Rhodobacteraceae bacterium]|nr:hypothetical protein [Paracoccaceae bacterium]